MKYWRKMMKTLRKMRIKYNKKQSIKIKSNDTSNNPKQSKIIRNNPNLIQKNPKKYIKMRKVKYKTKSKFKK